MVFQVITGKMNLSEKINLKEHINRPEKINGTNIDVRKNGYVIIP